MDTIFCGKCSENIPSTEARVRKNRCGNCYTCPSCKQELSVRIASSKAPTANNPEDAKTVPKKMYYLSCPFCRWSSRDVGIPDQSTGNELKVLQGDRGAITINRNSNIRKIAISLETTHLKNFERKK